MNYARLITVHVKGDWQAVAPVHPCPPHCPHWGTEPLGGVGAEDGEEEGADEGGGGGGGGTDVGPVEGGYPID